MSQSVQAIEPLWDAMDVAAYLKVSRAWVYLHGDLGDLPELRVGGLRRYQPSAIRAYALGKPAPGQM